VTQSHSLASIHAVIGVGEAAITILILAAVAGARPELMDSIASPSPVRDVIPFGLILTAGLVLFVAPFASGWPDGLERVASLLGFDHAAASGSPVASPLAGYEIPGLGSAAVATAVAGAIGALLTLGLSFFLARMLSRNARSSSGGP